MKILFVDDCPEDVELEVRALTRAGIDVQPLRVETEIEMTEALRFFQPDLVISDFRLPQMDGRAALRLAGALPFLFVSGSGVTVPGTTLIPKERIDDLPAVVRGLLG